MGIFHDLQLDIAASYENVDLADINQLTAVVVSAVRVLANGIIGARRRSLPHPTIAARVQDLSCTKLMTLAGPERAEYRKGERSP